MEEFVVAAVVADRSEERERIYLKRLRDQSNPFDRSERKFRKLFRFSKERAQQIVNELCAGNVLDLGTIPSHLKVLCALNFLATYQTAVGEINIIAQSQPSVSRSLSAVCDVIISRLTPQWIRFPITREEKETIMREFRENYAMPFTLGAVDGTQIGIHKPPLNHPTAPGNLFYNRKGFYSINCQVVCDAQGCILSVNPNFPGSTHDAAIWTGSNVNHYLEEQFVQGEQNQWLIGDKGYPLLPWLMIPHPEPAPGSAEERFNKCHAKARGVIEMTFGRLKNKFRCLHRHRILHYSPEKAAKIILSCCTLHNILVRSDLDSTDSSDSSNSDDDTEAESESSEDEEENNSEDDYGGEEEIITHDYVTIAHERRAALINNFF